MGDKPATAAVDAPQTLGFWGKTKLAVKEFFNGAIQAAPKALLFSGMAFAGSAAMGYAFDFNPLHVETFDKELVARMIGSVALGSTISGAINSVQSVMRADDAPTQTTAAAPSRTVARSADMEPEMAFDGVPQMTPSAPRVTNRARV